MSADTTVVTVGKSMPWIAGVRHIRDHIASITWVDGLQDGITEDVDLMPAIMQHQVFQPLIGDIGLFASVQRGENGNSLIWDKGRIDMAAATVEQLTVEPIANT